MEGGEEETEVEQTPEERYSALKSQILSKGPTNEDRIIYFDEILKIFSDLEGIDI